MNATTRQSLEDFKLPVKLKLSALWTAIMFCYIYGDFWGLYRPGNLKGILDGQGPLGPTSQGTLVAVAILVATSAVMIFASLVLAPAVNRWTNIILAAALTIIIALTLPGAWTFYILFSAIEMTLQVLIIGYAWRWPRTAADPQGSRRDATIAAASPLST